MSRRVALIYTGGTIGMVKSKLGYIPARGDLARRIETIPLLHEGATASPRSAPPSTNLELTGSFVTPRSVFGKRIAYELFEYDHPMDSANMGPEDWVRIARGIAELNEHYSAFVLLHGTDTMAYTASALSFMLWGLSKTVIVTGSQIPLSEVRNDAVDNLLGALKLAGHFDIPEVGIFFHNKLLRGNRCRKVDASGLDAFRSGNLHPLANVESQVEVHWSRIRAPAEVALEVRPITNRNVASVRIFPGITSSILDNFLQPPIAGVVLETYGAGNAPVRDAHFLHALERATNRGVVLVSCTQCHRGRVTSDYASGRALADVGVVPGVDMTPEASLTKLAYILSRGISTDETRRLMAVDLRGELTPTDRQVPFTWAEANAEASRRHGILDL